ncbi:MAG: HAMP domain-containing sensor histidine kinase [Candidatus Desantisbacteria bacterium]
MVCREVGLRKLLSPVSTKEADFAIYLDFNQSGIDKFKAYSGIIEPFPVLDYFDYRLSGEIDENGRGMLIFQNGVDRNIPQEKISVSVKLEEGMAGCGKIKIDVRAFDRDATSIDELMRRAGLKDENGNFMGKTEARNLLNDSSGVGIYREGFRIRPHGDAGYDWLELDKRRVQNPSTRVGCDQIAGYITVESEEVSHLREKSSREGLIEDKYFKTLVKAVIISLSELEIRRFVFRKKIGRGRVATDIEKSLETIFDFSGLEKSIDGMVLAGKIDRDDGETLITRIRKEREEKGKCLEEIRETLARYEGQVTLGKIIGVLMHEGRKPLKYIAEECPRIVRWMDNLRQKEILLPEDSIFTKDEIIGGLADIKKEGELLITLFNSLDPLAVKKRKKPSIVDMKKIVSRMYTLFKGEIARISTEFIRDFEGDFAFYGVENEVYIALTNLMDNSIYWLSTIEKEKKLIRVSLKYEGNRLILDFADNGPGIKEGFVESIFEPGFSTKPDGTGLGLSIAGEVISRNNGKIQLLDYKEGAYFRIELPERREK